MKTLADLIGQVLVVGGLSVIIYLMYLWYLGMIEKRKNEDKPKRIYAEKPKNEDKRKNDDPEPVEETRWYPNTSKWIPDFSMLSRLEDENAAPQPMTLDDLLPDEHDDQSQQH